MKHVDRLLEDSEKKVDILIVGAGMAGLTAASELKHAGCHVLVIDKGRGVGGRLASRRIEGATFDHGAQFMTARDPRFAAAMDDWLIHGVVEEWYRSPEGPDEHHLRWRGRPTMTALAKHLARDVEVLLEKQIVSLRPVPSGWVARSDAGESVFASAALLTPPVPQSLGILEAGGCDLLLEKKTLLESIEYERCLAVMAVLQAPARIPPPGGLAPKEGPIAWIADNQMKGVSAIPAVTIHATAAFSLKNWDRDRQESGRSLLRSAESWLRTDVTRFEVHGWRYSKPARIEASPCMILSQAPPLLLAGDAFGGPHVEGAALSGWEAAKALKKMDLNPT
jgi:predicted NAD/FAD-dependent oxidoreductase